jgi:hypothetical protein
MPKHRPYIAIGWQMDLRISHRRSVLSPSTWHTLMNILGICYCYPLIQVIRLDFMDTSRPRIWPASGPFLTLQ